MQISQFMLGLTQNVSLLALLIVGYVGIQRIPQMTPVLRNGALGLLFGLGAIVSMMTSVNLASGVLLDGRTIVTGLAPFFGGWIAVLVTDVVAIGYRIWIGGPIHAPWLGMVVASALGIAFWQFYKRRGRVPGFAGLWLLGLLISAVNFALIVIRAPEFSDVVSVERLHSLAAPLLIINPLAMAILGVALRREDDRLALQRRLDEQTDLFQAIFGAMSDGVTVANAKGEMVMRNPKAVELAGATPKLPAIKDWGLAFGTQEVGRDTPFPGTDLPLVKAVRGESSDDVELDVIRAQDGTRRTLSVSGRPLLDRDGKSRGGVVVFRDITAQRRAARELQKSELRLKDAISAMEAGFALFDAEDRLVLYNNAFLDEGTRLAFGDPTGRTFEEIVRAFVRGDPTAVEARADPDSWLRWRLALHRDPPEKPTEMQHTDGQWFRFTERVTAEGGRVAIWTDITPLKGQQRDLEAANRKLQAHAAELSALASKLDEEKRRADDANQEKSIFLAGMSHELRTPLNGILGFADMITQEIYGPVTPRRYRDYAELIHESGAHLLSLINDILDLSKIEAGKAVLHVEALRPSVLAEAAVTMVARLARDHGVRLSVTIDPDCKAVYADDRSAKQMILNLLSNAVKFTPGGGEVRLLIRGAAGGAEIVVTDTGHGMTEEELKTALAVYGQVDGVASRLNGTGLGLPLTKALAELHGGRLEIASRKGAGTTATIHLPDLPHQAI